MTAKKSVLVIGLQPTLIDFSAPDYAGFPGLDAAKVLAALKADEERLNSLGTTCKCALPILAKLRRQSF
jgi:hypothetical protein